MSAQRQLCVEQNDLERAKRNNDQEEESERRMMWGEEKKKESLHTRLQCGSPLVSPPHALKQKASVHTVFSL